MKNQNQTESSGRKKIQSRGKKQPTMYIHVSCLSTTGSSVSFN